MINLLFKLFLPDKTDIKKYHVRCGLLSGGVGIAVNLLLFSAKMFAGSVSGSIAIRADAFNNLSDAASSFVNIFGFKLSEKPADEEHPFGHGRIEYICGMIVTFFIFLMGFELVKASIEKIIHYEPVVFSVVSAVILSVSILAKLWLAVFNKKLGKISDSPAISAVATDSLGDSAATTATLIALILSKFTSLPLDGFFGVGVAIFIFIAGYHMFTETLGPLLGQPPKKEFVEALQKKILSYKGVVGIHDLVIHDYGPGRLFGSIHAEIPSTADIMESHDTLDLIEHDVMQEFGMILVIHLDPIVVDDEKLNELKKQTEDIVKGIDEALSIHDFRVVDGPSHTNLIFDLVTPHNYRYKSSEIKRLIDGELEKLDKTYYAVITVEQSYI
ncbi:MAG: cation diffusion facilitator family transporter [Clostridiales bacterium]|nr:cation diffusion facilitator family transporter [Clostridiales bacterium]